jgi:hypothetical protein
MPRSVLATDKIRAMVAKLRAKYPGGAEWWIRSSQNLMITEIASVVSCTFYKTYPDSRARRGTPTVLLLSLVLAIIALHLGFSLTFRAEWYRAPINSAAGERQVRTQE